MNIDFREMSDGEMIRANRTYKDTAMRMLFSDKSDLLELYNAINNSDYTDPDELEVVTLENAIYMNQKNDIAFILGTWLNLYEHQSTKNPNMPLRDLLYVAKEYQTMISENSLYSSRKITIPAPRFVVLYNGIEEQPERRVLKLSDLYEPQVDDPELELKVTVLNINYGYNKEIMERCPKLKQYAQFVECVRKYIKVMPFDLAVDAAVDECIQEGILRDFLIKQRAEVKSMWLFDYNEKEVMEMLKREAQEDGREAGLREGRLEGRLEGRHEGRLEGRREGRLEGRHEGRLEGRHEGRLEGLRLAISNLVKNTGMTVEQAMNVLEVPDKNREEYIKEFAASVPE